MLIYLAAPYTHKDRAVMVERFEKINVVAARLMATGLYVFSPISHTHPIADAGELPRGWEFWNGYDRVMLSRCNNIHVLTLDGWKESTGVNAEIQIAREFGMPVYYITPECSVSTTPPE
jgi:hypothetical protein